MLVTKSLSVRMSHRYSGSSVSWEWMRWGLRDRRLVLGPRRRMTEHHPIRVRLFEWRRFSMPMT